MFDKMMNIGKGLLMEKKSYFLNQKVYERFIIREIHTEESFQAAQIEKACFAPHEACSEKMIQERIYKAADLFLVAIDQNSGNMIGFINGISTDEDEFRDEFFDHAELHDPNGKNMMILGFCVLPMYQKQGIGKTLMYAFMRREFDKKRESLILTCAKSKIRMYEKFGFQNRGISHSTWGGEQWYEMCCYLNFEE